MTWTVSCGDVMPGCTAVLVGDARDAVLSAVRAHAGSDHGVVDLDAATSAAVEAASGSARDSTPALACRG